MPSPQPRPHYPRQDNQNPKFDFSRWEKRISQWIKEDIDKETVEFADEFGKAIKENNLTTSQIRIAFGELRKIQMNTFANERSSFIMLKPKLAYAVKRHSNEGLTLFYNLFSKCYDAVDIKSPQAEKQFENLLKLIEAVLAYHKYHGGKE